MTAATVPTLMQGCWMRAWIRFADGSIDDSSRVVWLQTPSAMVDVRIPAERPDLSHRGALGECSLDDLRAIAGSDASSGYTECGPVSLDDEGRRTATACWHTRGHGVNFQPVSAFPEPGLMSWSEDGTVMVERAPSGAYVEQWDLVPGSRDQLTMSSRGDHVLYRAGDVVVLVRDRVAPIPRPARLSDLIDEYEQDRSMVEALLDCEFSVAKHHGSKWSITASTLPWREGKVLDVDLR